MKRSRIMKIKEIIQNQVIETQEELAEALRKEGINVTQATVSRDIKELRLVKIPYKDGKYRYAANAEKIKSIPRSHASIMFQESVTHIDHTGNLVVIQTLPGAANSVASLLDHAEFKNKMGTIDGDDTILIILRHASDYDDFVKFLNESF